MALLFWFPLLLSVLVTAIGVGYRVPGLLWIGILLSLPDVLYLAATPRFGPAALLFLVCQVAGALAVRRAALAPPSTPTTLA